MWLQVCQRKDFGRATDRYGINVRAATQPAYFLSHSSGWEHYAAIHPMIGNNGTAEPNTDIHRIEQQGMAGCSIFSAPGIKTHNTHSWGSGFWFLLPIKMMASACGMFSASRVTNFIPVWTAVIKHSIRKSANIFTCNQINFNKIYSLCLWGQCVRRSSFRWPRAATFSVRLFLFVNDHSFRSLYFQNYTLNDDQPGFVYF